MATTAVQALRYPALGDAANGPVALQNLALDVEPKLVMVFATSAARTTAIPAPTEGMASWVQDSNRIDVYDGTRWRSTGPVVVADVTARNALTTYDGLEVYRADTHNVETFNGTLWYSVDDPWTAYTPVITGYTTVTFSNVAGHYLISGRTCWFRATWQIATVTTLGAGTVSITLPKQASASIVAQTYGCTRYRTNAGGYSMGICEIAASTNGVTILTMAPGGTASLARLSGATPAGQVVGDSWVMWGTYEIA